MKRVGRHFICTDKELKDLALMDKMFHKMCRGVSCDKCVLSNSKKDNCTASLFLNRILRQSMNKTKAKERGII